MIQTQICIIVAQQIIKSAGPRDESVQCPLFRGNRKCENCYRNSDRKDWLAIIFFKMMCFYRNIQHLFKAILLEHIFLQQKYENQKSLEITLKQTRLNRIILTELHHLVLYVNCKSMFSKKRFFKNTPRILDQVFTKKHVFEKKYEKVNILEIYRRQAAF